MFSLFSYFSVATCPWTLLKTGSRARWTLHSLESKRLAADGGFFTVDEVRERLTCGLVTGLRFEICNFSFYPIPATSHMYRNQSVLLNDEDQRRSFHPRPWLRTLLIAFLLVALVWITADNSFTDKAQVPSPPLPALLLKGIMEEIALGLAPPAWPSFPALSHPLCTLTSLSRTRHVKILGFVKKLL